MANNQPNVDSEVDTELEHLKDIVPGLRESTEKAPETAVPIKDSEVPPKKGEAPEPKPDAPKAPEDKKPEDKKEDEPPVPRVSRPAKYIPIVQYTSEKKAAQARIAELEGLLGTKKGTEESDRTIKEYADKHGMDEESVRDLIKLVTPPGTKPGDAAKPAEIDPAVQEKLAKADEILAENFFSKEFNDLAVPQLKELYPSATAEQLSNAKKEIEQIACTEEFLDKPLDFVVFRNKQALAEIFAPDRKGPESARSTPDKVQTPVLASDFETAKPDFSKLDSLSPEKRNEIIDKMSIQTYMKFSQWNDQNEDLVINKGRRK